MWKTQDYDQGIFQIFKFTQKTLHLTLVTLETEVLAASSPTTSPPIQNKEKASECILKTSEAAYAGRGLIINDQKKH